MGMIFWIVIYARFADGVVLRWIIVTRSANHVYDNEIGKPRSARCNRYDPPKANRKIQRDYEAEVYKLRHLVENYFAKVEYFRGIATRYDKMDCSYAACWNLIASR